MTDALLLSLGAELDQAIAAEEAADDDDFRAAAEISRTIVRQIMPIPATSLEGLRVKAKAYRWAHPDEFDDAIEPDQYTDTGIARSIVKDLLAMQA